MEHAKSKTVVSDSSDITVPAQPSAWRRKTVKAAAAQDDRHEFKAIGFSLKCNCACEDAGPIFDSFGDVDSVATSTKPVWASSKAVKMGLISYIADLDEKLIGPPLRSGEFLHLMPDDDRSSSVQRKFECVKLSLYANGFEICPLYTGTKNRLTFLLSPFSLVQACRMHSVEADQSLSWLRLFKVSIFQHGSTHFFAAHADADSDADTTRTRWVADISRIIRSITQSLFVEYRLRSDPLPGFTWTDTRLLAGYLLLCDEAGVSLVYSELHCHMGTSAIFASYEDEACDVQVIRLELNMYTCISERVGVDCSCFSFDGYHFCARTASEKIFWLRAISNVKVKLRHCAPDPTIVDLKQFRASIDESVERESASTWLPSSDLEFTKKPLLRQCSQGRKNTSDKSYVGPGWLYRQRPTVGISDTIGVSKCKSYFERRSAQSEDCFTRQESNAPKRESRIPMTRSAGPMPECGLIGSNSLSDICQSQLVPPTPVQPFNVLATSVDMNGRSPGLNSSASMKGFSTEQNLSPSTGLGRSETTELTRSDCMSRGTEEHIVITQP